MEKVSEDKEKEALNTQNQEIDVGRRQFLAKASLVATGVAAGFVAVPFLSTWKPTVRTSSSGLVVDVDVSKLEVGQVERVIWKKQPIFIFKRNPQAIAFLESEALRSKLLDADSKNSIQPDTCKNNYRSIKPEYAVLIGVCTHLGCAPNYKGDQSDQSARFFCPCHGSGFDLAGRVYSGMPATRNLDIPPYAFTSDTVITIG